MHVKYHLGHLLKFVGMIMVLFVESPQSVITLVRSLTDVTLEIAPLVNLSVGNSLKGVLIAVPPGVTRQSK